MPYQQSRPPSLPVMVELPTISTPRESAITVTLGSISDDVLQRATDARVRALPVLDEGGRCLGSIEVEKLRQLAEANQPLAAEHATATCDILPHLVPVTTLVEALAEYQMVLHRADPDDGFGDHWFGIITLSDVNRPIFRAYIYRMLVILETSLGQLIMDEFGDDWGAIRLLSDHTQGRIRDFWEEEKAEGVDLSPVTNATLSDLFHIAVTSNRVWSLMGFDAPADLRPYAQTVNDLRNHIMHPVRPLIVNDAEMKQLVEGVQAVDMLISRLTKQIGNVAG